MHHDCEKRSSPLFLSWLPKTGKKLRNSLSGAKEGLLWVLKDQSELCFENGWSPKEFRVAVVLRKTSLSSPIYFSGCSNFNVSTPDVQLCPFCVVRSLLYWFVEGSNATNPKRLICFTIRAPPQVVGGYIAKLRDIKGEEEGRIHSSQ